MLIPSFRDKASLFFTKTAFSTDRLYVGTGINCHKDRNCCRSISCRSWS